MKLLWVNCAKVDCRKRGIEVEDGYRLCAKHAREYRELVPPSVRRERGQM